MGKDAILVRKPSWIRMVNPAPICILGMTWRYGSHVMTEPGGVFIPISGDKSRILAMYHPPTPPISEQQAPPDTLALYTLGDFRLLADGLASYGEPDDGAVFEHAPDMPAASVRVGDSAGVPRTRRVWAQLPGSVRCRRLREPYRDRVWGGFMNRPAGHRLIRPGGRMTVFTLGGENPGMLLTVSYQANSEYRGSQCETGAWFHIPEQEFLRMKLESEQLAELEARERAEVIKMMQSAV
jgi:hypothetical protein